ncbi:nucleoside hydrolase [Pluteus cervinus]|uniref:Nucleoside hydrolase n=1 Tax=Pluteus cervinus TaxID=181527 RepID=A0ACD3BCM7_9AGAR|nr:nucleoside hydrolase [Pluteus cervinus]
MVTKIPVIIDTDPGVDDVIAILLALTSPEFEILAFIISYGNTDRGSSYDNIFKVHQAISRHIIQHPEHKDRFHSLNNTSKPILVAGAEFPLQGDLHSAQYFHGRDGLGDISTRHPELNLAHNFREEASTHFHVSEEPGADVILNILRERAPRAVTYIALGPLTNLLLAMKSDPEVIRGRMGKVVCMGGALDVPGNTSPVAEFNFFADPFAVRELLLDPTSAVKLPLERFFLLPLDITTPHELPFPVYRDRIDPSFQSTAVPSTELGKQPLVHFTSSFLERTREIMLQFGKDAMELHDVVAVWFAMENPPFSDDLALGWKTRTRVFEIERTGELTRGMLVVDRRDDASAYAPGANRAFVQEELRKLDNTEQYWESTALPAQVEVEDPLHTNSCATGVTCVWDTPGPDKLLRILLARIWGVE